MSESKEYCVILAGGSGDHFWPLSREDRPKQFNTGNFSKSSFLQKSYRRMLGIFDEEHIYISSQSKYKKLILEQLPEISEDRLILEPYGKNTGPTIAFVAHTLIDKDPDAVMVITPCDQEISDLELFAQTIRKGLDYASSNNALLTLGLVPTSPNTNFGYVQVKGSYTQGEPIKAKTFTEKPSSELAKVFVESGEFLWNSGIFIWKAKAILEEMNKCCPEITRLWKSWQKELGTVCANRLVEHVYTDSPNISIDYAVLEKSNNLYVLPSNFGWSDVGNWNAFYENYPDKDEKGNMSFVFGKSILEDNTNSIIYGANPEKLLVVRGLENYMVVDTEDALLICPREEQLLKDTLSSLKSPGYEEYK